MGKEPFHYLVNELHSMIQTLTYPLFPLPTNPNALTNEIFHLKGIHHPNKYSCFAN
jgi:hypothetical protein